VKSCCIINRRDNFPNLTTIALCHYRATLTAAPAAAAATLATSATTSTLSAAAAAAATAIATAARSATIWHC